MMRARLEIDADALARPRGDLPLDFDNERLTRGERHVKKRLAAEMLGDLDFTGERSLVGVDDFEMLRPDTHRHRLACLRRGVGDGQRELEPGLAAKLHFAVPGPSDFAGDEVHARRADEPGDEEIGRMIVEIERRPDLLDHAGAQHDDAVGERHRLDLVVRDKNHGHAELTVQPVDPARRSSQACHTQTSPHSRSRRMACRR